MNISDTQGGTNGDLKSTSYGSSLSNNTTNSSRDGFIGLLDMFGFENAQVRHSIKLFTCIYMYNNNILFLINIM